MTDSTRKPWDMKDGETAKAFQAFQAYRDLGPDRSIAKAGQSFLGDKWTTGRLKSWQKWSSKWGWVDRARAWDSFLDGQVQDIQVQAVIDMNLRHAQLAQKVLALVTEKLDRMKVHQLTPTQVIRWLEIGAKVERMARGQADTMMALTLDVEDMTDEELEDLVKGL